MEDFEKKIPDWPTKYLKEDAVFHSPGLQGVTGMDNLKEFYKWSQTGHGKAEWTYV